MKKEYNPYKIGRWYRLFIESDGNAHTITESDIDDAVVSDESDAIIFPVGFHLVDSLFDSTLINDATASKFNEVGNSASGNSTLTIPDVSAYSSAFIYVFGYFD